MTDFGAKQMLYIINNASMRDRDRIWTTFYNMHRLRLIDDVHWEIFCDLTEMLEMSSIDREEFMLKDKYERKSEKICQKDNGWIPVTERYPDPERKTYEVTFTNECGYPDHGFAQWYDGDFHIPAVVTAWREHIEPYQS